jgi:hypothetical protein
MAGHDVPQAPRELDAAVMVDLTDKTNPLVLVRFGEGDMTTTIRIKARAAAGFGVQLGQAIVQAGQQALAAAGPQIVTPNGVNGLLIPGPGGAPGGRG